MQPISGSDQDALVTLDGTFEQIPGRVLSVTGTDALGTGNMLTRTVVVAVPMRAV